MLFFRKKRRKEYEETMLNIINRELGFGFDTITSDYKFRDGRVFNCWYKNVGDGDVGCPVPVFVNGKTVQIADEKELMRELYDLYCLEEQ